MDNKRYWMCTMRLGCSFTEGLIYTSDKEARCLKADDGFIYWQPIFELRGCSFVEITSDKIREISRAELLLKGELI